MIPRLGPEQGGMKVLTFLARRFWWKAYSRTLDSVEESAEEGSLEETVVAFVHAEARDEDEAARARVRRHLLKHLKWLAGKRELENVVLHSFTHLGGENADPAFAQGLLDEVASRLRDSGYEVRQTPFGHFCEWGIDVYGESLAKVWKEI